MLMYDIYQLYLKVGGVWHLPTLPQGRCAILMYDIYQLYLKVGVPS